MVLNDLGSFLFALVQLFKAFLHIAVVVLHLEPVVFEPALLDLPVNLLLALLKLNLRVTLLQDIREEHLRVEGLHLVLGVVHLLIRLLYRLETLLLVVGFLFCIDTSSFELFLFELAVAVLDPLVPHVLDSVGPVLNAGTRTHLQVGAVLIADLLIQLHLRLSTIDTALLSQALEVVDGNNRCVFILLSVDIPLATAVESCLASCEWQTGWSRTTGACFLNTGYTQRGEQSGRASADTRSVELGAGTTCACTACALTELRCVPVDLELWLPAVGRSTSYRHLLFNLGNKFN